MCENQKIKASFVASFSRLSLLAIVLFSIADHLVVAEPEPLPPGLIYSDSYADDAETFLLLQKLKQIAGRKNEVMERARELDNEKMLIQSVLDGEEMRRNSHGRQSAQNDYSAEEAEMLPIPSAIIHNDAMAQSKRTPERSFITLCHFKICNMGRKRQSRDAVKP